MSDENIYSSPESNLEEHTQEQQIYAGFWVRVGASIIDTFIMLAITFPALTFIYGKNYWASETSVQGFWDILFSYIFPAAAVILFWIYKSATPGKMIFGLKIVSSKIDAKPSPLHLIVRYIGYYISMFPLFLGILWVAWDPKKQGWHDKLAGTVVVKS